MAKKEKKLYIDIMDYKNADYPIQAFIGGRGIGKTYSALSHMVQDGTRFIYTRRTKTEIELILDTDKGEGANPLKAINADFGTDLGFKAINQNLAGLYARSFDEEKQRLVHQGTPLAYAIGLSAIAGVRGLDFSDCTDWIYDEFIPEKHVKKLKGECDALLNGYETINRNRELKGKPPLNLWLLSNASDIANPIFVGLGIVGDVERAIRKGKKDIYFKERGLAIHLLESTEAFQEAKAQTALYKLTKNSDFSDMALENKFSYNDFSFVEYRRLQGYQPFCALDNAYIYRKKGSREYYVSYAPCKCDHFSASNPLDCISFRRRYAYLLHDPLVEGKVIFESYELKDLLIDFII